MNTIDMMQEAKKKELEATLKASSVSVVTDAEADRVISSHRG